MHKHFKEFNASDYIMVRLRSECFPSRTICKLQAHSVEPFRVIKCMGANAYFLDLPPSHAANPTLNIENFTAYHPPIIIPKL